MSAYEGPALKRIEFLVLAVLAESPLHGYGIARRISERTGGQERVRPGSLYRVLDRLQRRGLLEPSDRRPVGPGEDERRTYYGITALGRRAVTHEARLLRDVAAGLVGDAAPDTRPA